MMVQKILRSIILSILPYSLALKAYKSMCRTLLMFINGIKVVGYNNIFFKGIEIYNGINISLGNNINLSDVLLSAGNTEKGSITIGDNVFFGHKVMVLARSHDYTKIGSERAGAIEEKPIIIKKGAWIASGSIILGGVTIGKNAVVGAGSVVTKDVDDNSLFAGNPAKFIKKI